MGDVGDEEDVGIPATVWGSILGFLPYDDVRSALLVCRVIGHDATKHVESLNLTRSTELDVRVARRFPNLSAVYVGSLVIDAYGVPGRHDLCEDTMRRILPFLQSVRKLQHVRSVTYFRGCRSPIQYRPFCCEKPEDHKDRFRFFLEAFCGAFRAKALPQLLKLEGIVGGTALCPIHETTRPIVQNPFSGVLETVCGPSGCMLCRNICFSFPLWNLMKLKGVEGGKLSQFESSMWHFDVCIYQEEIYKIIRERYRADKENAWSEPEMLQTILSEGFGRYGMTGEDFQRRMVEMGAQKSRNSFSASLCLPGHDVLFIERRAFEKLDLMLELGCRPSDYSKSFLYDFFMSKAQVGDKSETTNLFKSTYDRLLSMGFEVDPNDFIVVDDNREPALEIP